MAELTNVAYFTAKPGRSQYLGAELLQLVTPSRNEEGCLRYEIHQSNDVADVWMVLEDWRHASDFKLHMSTNYVQAFMAKVPDLCVEDVEICGYQQRSPQA
ncbi:antibiotic biosynthesis monooxygenase [Rhizobium laguerreae]|uniref:putative quinol monooxygenase n=1 Tax=Rhizobium laguerreae TaxID=1076926 RepID=UPI0014426393|nr:putative quinol monooxygenase [Rhizobium laguerreae]MBY3252304.1 antibiotic biosynthesis monooxygenase [Rhizobium laguerreae]MBY3328420.1 antibiotic biosynthesis monooxygenase [Rhizobium laguerreae]NKM31852.1 antibiotic biosynthesis monooxygenase [Rhizobium laguerreae]